VVENKKTLVPIRQEPKATALPSKKPKNKQSNQRGEKKHYVRPGRNTANHIGKKKQKIEGPKIRSRNRKNPLRTGWGGGQRKTQDCRQRGKPRGKRQEQGSAETYGNRKNRRKTRKTRKTAPQNGGDINRGGMQLNRGIHKTGTKSIGETKKTVRSPRKLKGETPELEGGASPPQINLQTGETGMV